MTDLEIARCRTLQREHECRGEPRQADSRSSRNGASAAPMVERPLRLINADYWFDLASRLSALQVSRQIGNEFVAMAGYRARLFRYLHDQRVDPVEDAARLAARREW